MMLTDPSSALKGYLFPRSVIGYAVWAYLCFVFSPRDGENTIRGAKHWL